MKDLAQYAGQLGAAGIFVLLVLYMVLNFLKDRGVIKTKTTPILPHCKAGGCTKMVEEMHKAIMKEDGDGVKLIHTRHSLEKAMDRLATTAEAQTKLLTKLCARFDVIRERIR